MKRILAVSALFALMVSSSASALSSGSRSEWSTLSAERLQQLPLQITSAIRAVQKACGDDEPRVRAGFLRYLKGRNGEEFISLHFDQFHCARSSTLCNSAGCLHRVFVSKGRQAREVWRGHVYDIDMDDFAGRAGVNIRGCDACTSRLQWNGKTFFMSPR